MRTLVCSCVAIALCAAVVGSLAGADLKGKSPQQVYEIYRKALKKDDVDAIMECMSKKPEGGKAPTKAELKMMLPMMKAMIPSDVKVTKSDVKQSKATLTVEGEGVNPFTQKKEKTKGSVKFVKEGGVWKISKESWGSGSAQPGGMPGRTGTPVQMNMGMDFEPVAKETFTGLAHKIDGSLADWKGEQPVVKEVGKAGSKLQGSIDVKKMYFKEDVKYYYIFLTTEPTIEERWKKSQMSGGLCDIYLDMDQDESTGCKDVMGFRYGKISGYEYCVGMVLGQQSGPDGDKPFMAYTLKPADKDGKFPFFGKDVFEQSAMDEGSLVAHGKDGVELAIPKSKIRLVKDKKPAFLIKEFANSFDKEGYTEWPERPKGEETPPKVKSTPASSVPVRTGKSEISIKAFIDHEDIVKIRGNEVWLENKAAALPGKWDNNNHPAYVNKKKWMPEWEGKKSRPYGGLKVELPSQAGTKVKIAKTYGRGQVTILEQPSEKNKYTLSLRFFDSDGGADWLEAVIRW